MVCYNSYEDSRDFLCSIEKSLRFFPDLKLTVIFSDNSTINVKKAPSDFTSDFFHFVYSKNDNVGYFPSFYKSLEMIDCNKFDYIMVSNVDLDMDFSFFSKLSEISFDDDVGILAPSIVSSLSNSDSNPKMLHRPSKKKLLFNRNLFSNTFYFTAYDFLSHMKRRFFFINPKRVNNDSEIYAPHGAFIIFTRNYINSNARLDYPRFLFGEEVFIGEECRLANLKIVYKKELKLFDKQHGAISFESRKFISAEHVKSYDYLITNYFAKG